MLVWLVLLVAYGGIQLCLEARWPALGAATRRPSGQSWCPSIAVGWFVAGSTPRFRTTPYMLGVK